MKRIFCTAAILLVMSTQLFAAEEEKSEAITSKMAVKFGKGVVNIVTSPLEIPRQISSMTRDYGFPGFLIGPFSGALMTTYRAVIGATETALFMVPAPGYYDNMIDPEFVWAGWEQTPKTHQITPDEEEEQP